MQPRFFFTTVLLLGMILQQQSSYSAPSYEFQGLGFLPGAVPESVAHGVSADGSVVVGGSGAGLASFEAFRWTSSTGMVGLGVAPGPGNHSEAFAVSGDGSVIVGTRNTGRGAFEAFRWTSSTGMIGLGNYARNAYGTSADGSVVVGDRRSGDDQEAFRWTQSSGVVPLGYLPTFPWWSPISTAFGVSADGSIVVGHSTSGNGVQQPFRWEDGTMTGLGDLPLGELHSGARAISANGSVIVGFGSSGAGQEAFRWTQSGGMVGLGDLPGGTFASIALAVSADGSVVVGRGTTEIGSEAFIWDAARGMRNLKDVLVGGGLDLSGWILAEARGVSADGRTVVGFGTNPAGQTEAWRATLAIEAPSLLGDYNGDGTVDASDYVAWRAGLGGNLGQAGYDTWRSYFGATLSGNGGIHSPATVPELSTAILLLAGLTIYRLLGRSFASACTTIVASSKYRSRRSYEWQVPAAALVVATVWSAPSRADFFGSGANAFEIEFVTIGSPGNAPDIEGNPTPSGAVDYVYRISKYEISEHMIDKAVAAAGLDINLRPRRGPDKPATSISWVEAAVFVNWLNTSSGAMPAYKITPPPPPYIDPVFNLWEPGDPGYDPANPYRNSLASYFLPSGDEWYKAAYYDPVAQVYYDFPVGRNAAPQSVASGTDPYTAVFNRSAPADSNQAGGLSPFGTMAQGGNIFELVETAYDRINDAVHEPREYRGGYWSQGADDMKRYSRYCLCHGPYSFGDHIGFRVASVADPSLPGDFNNDGYVDAADYILWRKTSVIGTEGYEAWRMNFGNARGTGTNADAAFATIHFVPEANSLTLGLLGGILVWSRRTIGSSILFNEFLCLDRRPL